MLPMFVLYARLAKRPAVLMGGVAPSNWWWLKWAMPRYLPATRDLRRLDAAGYPGLKRFEPRAACCALIFDQCFFNKLLQTLKTHSLSQFLLMFLRLLQRFVQCFLLHLSAPYILGSPKSHLQPLLRVHAGRLNHPSHAAAGAKSDSRAILVCKYVSKMLGMVCNGWYQDQALHTNISRCGDKLRKVLNLLSDWVREIVKAGDTDGGLLP